MVYLVKSLYPRVMNADVDDITVDVEDSDDDILVDVEDSDDDILADAEDTDEDTDTVIDEDDDIDRDFFDYMLIGNEDLGYANIPNTYIELTYDNIKEGTVAYQSPDEDETIIQIIPHSMSALESNQLQQDEFRDKSYEIINSYSIE